jgi:hypothetical protein
VLRAIFTSADRVDGQREKAPARGWLPDVRF